MFNSQMCAYIHDDDMIPPLGSTLRSLTLALLLGEFIFTCRLHQESYFNTKFRVFDFGLTTSVYPQIPDLTSSIRRFTSRWSVLLRRFTRPKVC